jgi:hypothetical protein
MSKRQSSTTFAGTLAVGAVLGALFAAWAHWPADTVAVCAAVGAVVVYTLSCARYPYARCPLPWCRSRLTRGDGHGHFRKRRPCVLHPDGGEYVRLGARLLGPG